MAKAGSRGADALILDLEDAVPAQEKSRAREVVGLWLRSTDAQTTQIWVRVNTDTVESDLTVLTPSVTGIVLPKAEPASLLEANELLTSKERALGVRQGHFHVLALVETARGLLDASNVAKAPRVERLGLGEVDLCAELRVDSKNAAVMTALRLQVVVASAAAAIAAPVGPMMRSFRDLDGLRESTLALQRLGFRARTCIHPAQLQTVNAVFTPTPDEVMEARRLVDMFEESEATGAGVLVGDDGAMVDAAVVRRAREVLSIADGLDSRSSNYTGSA